MLISLSLAIVMIEIDKLAVNVALPAIQHDFLSPFGLLQWTLSAYMLTLAAGLVIGGRLGDIFGRRRILLAGIAIFSVASLLGGLTQTPAELILARGVQGAGAALMYPAAFALVGTAYPEGRRGRALGAIATAAGFGMAAGPLLGGLLVQALSWRWVFFINPIVGIATVALVLRFVEEVRDPDADRRVDLPGALVLALALGGLMLACIEAADADQPLFVVSAFVAGAILLAGFVAIERRSPVPLLRLGLLRRHAFAGVQVVAVVSMFVVIAWLFVTTLELQHVLGASPLEAGVLLLPYVLAFLVLARPAGALTDRVGYWVPLVGGLAIMAAVMGILGLAAGSVPYDRLWALYALVGASQAMIWPALAATTINLSPPGEVGVAQGILQTGRWLAGALGVAVVGAVFSELHRGNLHERLGKAGFRASSELVKELDGLLAGSHAARARAAELAGGRGIPAIEGVARASEEHAMATSLIVLAVIAAVGVIVAAGLLRDARPRLATAGAGRAVGSRAGRGA